MLPRIEAGFGGGDRLFELFVGQILEALQDRPLLGLTLW
jgi:hypothetical protein